MSDAASRELDDAFVAIVTDWSAGGIGCDDAAFDAHARATFAYQIEHNEPYRKYAASLGVDAMHPPESWRDVPAVPSSAFKDATLATFDILRAECTFHTSGTTAATTGKHFVERARLYDASLVAGFDRFMLGDGARLRYLNLVPNPRQRPHSSLGYMMGHVGVLRGDGKAGYFIDGDDIDVPGFVTAVKRAIADAHPVCLAGTAFAFVAITDTFERDGNAFVLPHGSRIMETGGFKGRARVLEREELYAKLCTAFGVATSSIVAEYGMTELLSQYYDAPESRGEIVRKKVAPPWLRTLVVDADGHEVAHGDIGFLRHVDLANRSSAIAIETEDRGYCKDDGIVLLGRDADAPLRGCSLDAEDLLVRRA